MAQILSLLCKERDGEYQRLVVEMPREIKLWLEVTDHMKEVPNFLSKSDYNNTKVFLDERNKFYLIDDIGVAAVFPQEYFKAAHVHITFWDGKLRGREDLCRRLCEYVLQVYEFDHLFTAIPKTSETVLAFAKGIGFKDKGAEKGVVYLTY